MFLFCIRSCKEFVKVVSPLCCYECKVPSWRLVSYMGMEHAHIVNRKEPVCYSEINT